MSFSKWINLNNNKINLKCFICKIFDMSFVYWFIEFKVENNN